MHHVLVREHVLVSVALALSYLVVVSMATFGATP
jgi:hypothetical protein